MTNKKKPSELAEKIIKHTMEVDTITQKLRDEITSLLEDIRKLKYKETDVGNDN